MMYTMPGIPSIYYGSEYGVQGRKENNSDDNLRPCLHLADMERENIALYKHIVKLGRIYKAYPALRTGAYERIQITNQQLLFKKIQGEQTVYVALNLADYQYDFNFGTHLPALVDVIGGQSVDVNNGNAHISMPPFSAMIIVSDDIVNTAPEANPAYKEKSEETEAVVGGRYRHYKGNEYEIIAIARHTENNEELVIYKSLSDGNIWARPKAIFCGKSSDGSVMRFTKI
jgi:hypothetical protein